jgi:hypothetical protein
MGDLKCGERLENKEWDGGSDVQRLWHLPLAAASALDVSSKQLASMPPLEAGGAGQRVVRGIKTPTESRKQIQRAAAGCYL